MVKGEKTEAAIIAGTRCSDFEIRAGWNAFALDVNSAPQRGSEVIELLCALGSDVSGAFARRFSRDRNRQSHSEVLVGGDLMDEEAVASGRLSSPGDDLVGTGFGQYLSFDVMATCCIEKTVLRSSEIK